ncbi:MAG: MBL fold metallo-hydrolase [Chloroflexota bacterium]
MENSQELSVRFWGVRGSYPAPGPDTIHVGGNTPCVEVRAGRQVLILDAGTGIIALGRSLLQRSAAAGQPVAATLLFSHMHHDHTQGFPFFAPAFVPTTRLHIFGPHTFERDLSQVLAQNMVPPVFPITLYDMSASKEIHAISESSCLALSTQGGPPQQYPAGVHLPPAADSDRLLVRALRSYAHPGGTLIYRIDWRGQSLVYATDTEGYSSTDRRLADFARGAGLLIHDAQYTQEHYLGQGGGRRATQGWGHSTAEMACEVALAAGVERLALFHHDPTYPDDEIERIEAAAAGRFPGAFAAREGQEISLPAALSERCRCLETQPVLPALTGD